MTRLPLIAAAAVAVCAATVTGCSSSSTHSTAATTPQPSPSPSSPVATSPSPSVSPSLSPSPSPTTVSACTSSGLAVTIGPANSGAGNVYTPIVFTNHGNIACTLRGYPGVSFRDASGQVGPAASRDTTVSGKVVTLAPGASAHAVLHTSNADLYDPAKCRPKAVTTLRVYPPGQTAYVDLAHRGQVCSTAVATPNVQPVVAGG